MTRKHNKTCKSSSTCMTGKSSTVWLAGKSFPDMFLEEQTTYETIWMDGDMKFRVKHCVLTYNWVQIVLWVAVPFEVKCSIYFLSFKWCLLWDYTLCTSLHECPLTVHNMSNVALWGSHLQTANQIMCQKWSNVARQSQETFANDWVRKHA